MSQQRDVTLTPPSADELLTFFAQIKNSKKQVQEALLFSPDLRELHNRLFAIKDCVKFDRKENIRIRTLMRKIKTHVRGRRY